MCKPDQSKDIYLSALGEIISIGMVQAASTLEEIMGRQSEVHFDIPKVEFWNTDKIASSQIVEDYHGKNSSIKMHFDGPFSGTIGMLISKDSASMVVKMLNEDCPEEEVSVVYNDTLQEVGNMLLNSIMGTISNLFKQKIDYQVPDYKENQEDIVKFLGKDLKTGKKMLLSKTQFSFADHDVKGEICTAFEIESFEEVLNAIDITDLTRHLYGYRVMREKALEELKARTHAEKELKKQQSMLVHQKKMATVGQISAGIAHEINNPIGYICNNLSILQSYVNDMRKTLLTVEASLSSGEAPDKILKTIAETVNNEDLKEDLSDADDLIAESLDGSNRVKDIILNLKSFIHTDEHLDLKEADLNEGILSTIKIVRNSIIDKLDIETELGDLPSFPCLAGQLNQVFMNLIINSADAMTEKGQLHIKTTLIDPQKIVLEFKDNGPGIPKEIQSKVFDPFFTTKEVGAGTGLGLSICQKIIEKHNGQLTLLTTEQGAHFKIELPLS